MFGEYWIESGPEEEYYTQMLDGGNRLDAAARATDKWDEWLHHLHEERRGDDDANANPMTTTTRCYGRREEGVAASSEI